jgi:uncharacterized YceG family protein
VFAGIGERSREGNDIYLEMQESGALKNTALVFGQMNEVPGVRYRVPFTGLTIAEHFRDKEKKVWDKIEDKSNFYDTLTIGSLIEKEVNKEEDKKKVAHVILKRLEIDMLLQIDATILYVNNGFNSKIDSPYNTYKYKGLPITPICNPGLESIQAVLDPIENNYYYYLSDKNGVTYFSENYDQHVRYKNLYLR